MSESFGWEVYHADRRHAYQGASNPMASVRVVGTDGEPEYLKVPSSVGRRLASMKKSGDACPANREEVKALIRQCTIQTAWTQLLSLLGRRDYSELDAKQRLCRQGFSAEVAEDTVRKGVQCGIVSNERFAESYIRSKVIAGWGLERIDRELKVRGIDAHDLDGWPYKYVDPEQECSRAVQVASRKTVREPNRYAKMVRFLLGRGFSYGVASDAARHVLQTSGLR